MPYGGYKDNGQYDLKTFPGESTPCEEGGGAETGYVFDNKINGKEESFQSEVCFYVLWGEPEKDSIYCFP